MEIIFRFPKITHKIPNVTCKFTDIKGIEDEKTLEMNKIYEHLTPTNRSRLLNEREFNGKSMSYETARRN